MYIKHVFKGNVKIVRVQMWLVCAGTTGALWEGCTWNRRWGNWRQDWSLSFRNHAYPVLVGIAWKIVPPREVPRCAAHHLHAVFKALMVVGLPETPVGVSDRHAITPEIACIDGNIEKMKGFFQWGSILSHLLYSPPSTGLCLRPIHLLLSLL